MLFTIYDYPNWAMALAASLAFAAIGTAGLLLVRRWLHPWLHRDTNINEMVGFANSSFSMLYGLLLGLLAVAAYQGFSVTSDLALAEANTLAALHGSAGALPDPAGANMRTSLRHYTREVIDVSWPLQRDGVVPTGTSPIIAHFLDQLQTFEPKTMREQNLQSEALTLANDLVQIRRTRLNSVDGGIPDILWWVVLAGAVINIMLLWMLNMARHTHMILTALVSGFLGLVIFLVAAMDHPFRGDVSVGPEAFETVYQSLMLPDAQPSLRLSLPTPPTPSD